jgi:Sulfotransferase family
VTAPARPADGAPREEAERDSPLFLTSFPRSGSSLLRAMLDRHPDIAVLPEPRWMMPVLKALGRERQPLTRDVAAEHLRARVDPSWLAVTGLNLDDILQHLPDRISPGEAVAAAGYAYAARAGKARWGVKNPGADVRLSLRFLESCFPRSRVVFLARDPRDVYLSQVSAGWRRGLEDLELFCLLWAVQARRIVGDLGAMGRRGHVVRYEDLVDDPRKTLAELCAAVGLAASDSDVDRMLSYAEGLSERIASNPIHRNLTRPVLFANRRNFAHQLSAERVRRTEFVVRRVMRRLGYLEPTTQERADVTLWVADGLTLTAAVVRSVIRNIRDVARRRATPSGIRRRRPGAAG